MSRQRSFRLLTLLTFTRLAFGPRAKLQLIPVPPEVDETNAAMDLLASDRADMTPPLLLSPASLAQSKLLGLEHVYLLLTSRLLLISAPRQGRSVLTLETLCLSGRGLWATILAASLLRFILKRLRHFLRSSSALRLRLVERVRLALVVAIALALSVLANLLYTIFVEERPDPKPPRCLDELEAAERSGKWTGLASKADLLPWINHSYPLVGSSLEAARRLKNGHPPATLLGDEMDDLATYLTAYQGSVLAIHPDVHRHFYYTVFYRKELDIQLSESELHVFRKELALARLRLIHQHARHAQLPIPLSRQAESVRLYQLSGVFEAQLIGFAACTLVLAFEIVARFFPEDD